MENWIDNHSHPKGTFVFLSKVKKVKKIQKCHQNQTYLMAFYVYCNTPIPLIFIRSGQNKHYSNRWTVDHRLGGSLFLLSHKRCIKISNYLLRNLSPHNKVKFLWFCGRQYLWMARPRRVRSKLIFIILLFIS